MSDQHSTGGLDENAASSMPDDTERPIREDADEMLDEGADADSDHGGAGVGASSADRGAGGASPAGSPDTLGARGDDDDAASKDPADWVTGDEPMTAAQRSYLDTLAREAGEELPADLTKAQASIEIDRLQSETGRTS